jgi:ribosomal-protein-alanine N-acetyltransferase
VKTTTHFSLDKALAALHLAVEPMRPAHIAAVMDIEREAFSLPWPERAYRHELTQNDFAHYYALFRRPVPQPPVSLSAWQRLRQVVLRWPDASPDPMLGYAGFWLMYDEAHISTLAVRAECRRHGLGELLLVVLLEEGQRLGALRATLEVRVSNAAAQSLYAKYGFEQVGRRKAYYNDNREDALILTTPDFASPVYQDLLEDRRRGLLRRLDPTLLDKILQMN